MLIPFKQENCRCEPRTIMDLSAPRFWPRWLFGLLPEAPRSTLRSYRGHKGLRATSVTRAIGVTGAIGATKETRAKAVFRGLQDLQDRLVLQAHKALLARLVRPDLRVLRDRKARLDRKVRLDLLVSASLDLQDRKDLPVRPAACLRFPNTVATTKPSWSTTPCFSRSMATAAAVAWAAIQGPSRRSFCSRVSTKFNSRGWLPYPPTAPRLAPPDRWPYRSHSTTSSWTPSC